MDGCAGIVHSYKASDSASAQTSLSIGRKPARLLTRHFGVQSLDGFGCHGLTAVWELPGRSGVIFARLSRLLHSDTFGACTARRSTEAMHLDSATIRNLELVRPLAQGEDDPAGPPTLLSVMDRTSTAMGSRLLREWLLRPLIDR